MVENLKISIDAIIIILAISQKVTVLLRNYCLHKYTFTAYFFTNELFFVFSTDNPGWENSSPIVPFRTTKSNIFDSFEILKCEEVFSENSKPLV